MSMYTDVEGQRRNASERVAALERQLAEARAELSAIDRALVELLVQEIVEKNGAHVRTLSSSIKEQVWTLMVDVQVECRRRGIPMPDPDELLKWVRKAHAACRTADN